MPIQDKIIYHNGGYTAWEKASVHVMCHSLGRGSAIFEVLGFHDTVSGPAVFRLDAHLDRLCRSAALLGMTLPLSPGALQEIVLGTIRRNRLRRGFIKIIACYPQVSFEILPPQKKLTLSVFVFDPAEDLGDLDSFDANGCTCCIASWRKLDPRTVPVEAKVAANYLNGMLARSQARTRGFDYALMLDARGFVAEGGTESVFLVKDSRLMTPSSGTVLAGITRRSLLDAAARIGLQTLEGRFSPADLEQADEIFLAGTPDKVLPVRRMESRKLAAPGPISRKLAGMMEKILTGRDSRFDHWLFPVDAT